MRVVASVLVTATLLVASLVFADPGERQGRAVAVVHAPHLELPTIGPEHAPVTVEFFCNFNGDRNFPKYYAMLLELAERHPARLRIEFHIVGNAFSEAAYEAFDQGRFHEFARAAFGHGSRPRLSDLEQWADQAGMNYAELQRALEDGRHKPRIARAQALRARRGSRSSSKIVAFNGEFQARKATNLEELEETYDDHYRRAKALLDDGVPVDQLFARLAREAGLRHGDVPRAPGKVDLAPTVEPPPLATPALLASRLPEQPWPSRGPAAARVVMVLACSLQSDGCRDLYRRVELARADHADDVRVTLLPLFDDELHPDARLAHEATLCAGDQGKYWELVDQIFRVHRPHQLGLEFLVEHAEKAGLIGDDFARCVEGRRHADHVAEALTALRRAGVTYTPSLVVGGRIYVGMRSDTDLLALVNLELRPGLLERARELRRHILDTIAPARVDLSDPPTPPT